MKYNCVRLLLLVLAGLFAGIPVHAQGLSSLASKTAPSLPAAATDPLKRTTPRTSIYNFLQACHSNNFALASQYLDLRRVKSGAGPELARQLGALLDHDPHFEISRLSNSASGDLTDGLPGDRDELDSFDLDGRTVDLQLQRITQDAVPVWLVSADSTARIPELASLAGSSEFEQKLPRPLVSIKFVGTPLWIWLALIGIAILLSLLSRLLSRVFIAITSPLFKRYVKAVQTYRLEAFVEPLRLLLSVAVFRACMEMIPPSALLREYILDLLALLFVIGAASFAMRIVDVIADQTLLRLELRPGALSHSVMPLFVRMVKIAIFCFAALLILEQWGYPTSTIIAGVGVGGLAVALAAQKTIENLFGSISVLTDRPVLVGDVCQFGGQTGTVEDIGLRSTRIRTSDRTLVTIPNSVFSTMTLENFSRRDRIWFHPTLHLHRETTPEQIRQMLEAVSELLAQEPKVDASGVPLRFTKITNESFDVDIFAYVLTTDYNEFLKIQTELLLKILATVAGLDIRLAVPFQESISLPSPVDEGAKTRD